MTAAITRETTRLRSGECVAGLRKRQTELRLFPRLIARVANQGDRFSIEGDAKEAAFVRSSVLDQGFPRSGLATIASMSGG